MSRIQVIAGAAFGSEAKGAVAAKLAEDLNSPLCIRVGGPNAGHTVYDSEGRRWALQQVPVGLVTNSNATGYIAAGSEIDLDLLQKEVIGLEAAGHNVRARLHVSAEATILTHEHSELERAGKSHGEAGLTKDIGSTGKGVGAARAERLMRKAARMGDIPGGDYIVPIVREGWPVDAAIEADRPIQIEGTQGFGLGLHAGYYPFCTSGDCRAIDFMAQAGVNPWGHELEIWLVARVFPIRVAGNSGPMHEETTWKDLGLAQEHTTVTKKVRRVGQWDAELVQRAVNANLGFGNTINFAVTMLDQMFPGLEDSAPVEQPSAGWAPARRWLQERVPRGASLQMVGTGVRSHHYVPAGWDL